MTFRWNTLRDWVKVARELPKTRGHYPDGPLVAFVFAVCKAAEQPEPGTFDSVPILRAILDATGNKRGRHVPFLIEHGDFVVLPDGRATIPNWRTFQDEGKSTKRVQKLRAKRGGNAGGNAPETFHETPDVGSMERLTGAPPRRDSLTGVEPSHDGESTKVRDTRTDDVFDAMEQVQHLTNERPFSWGRGSPIFDTLAADVADLGLDRVTAEYRAVKAAADGQPIDAAGIVFGAHKRLYRIPDAPSGGRKPVAVGKGGVSDEEADRAFGRS